MLRRRCSGSCRSQSRLFSCCGPHTLRSTPANGKGCRSSRGSDNSILRKTADAIYRAKDERGRLLYGHVVLVGHSLGSVISYDTLNTMINADAYTGGKLAVIPRTEKLVTFGSPLNKIAFILASNLNKRTASRAALAATSQPLILSYAGARQIPWSNVYSPLDIISGSLTFYDYPNKPKDPNAIRNEIDPHAIVPLVAHVEYWENSLVWDFVREGICANRQP